MLKRIPREFKPVLIYGGLAALALAVAAGLLDQANEPASEPPPSEAVGEAAAQTLTPTQPPPSATFRVAHLSPDAGTLDIYANGVLLDSGLNYGQVGPAHSSATPLTVTVRLAGTAPDSTPLLQAELYLTPWSWHIVAIANTLANLQAGAYRIPLENIPQGYGRVQVLHAAPATARVHVKTGNNTIIARGIGYLEDPAWMDLPAGPHRLLIGTDTAPALLMLDRPTYTIQDGTVTTIIITGSSSRVIFVTTRAR